MELQALIDGLKAHKSGAASYESVDEAIRVFEAMRDVDGENVVKGLECFVNHVNGPYRDDCRKAECDYLKAGDCEMMVMSDALALIRQQQERIKKLEVAQTARVMTLEETDNAEVAWLEEYADPADGVEPIIHPVIIVWHENGCWHCLIDRNEDAGLDLFIDGLWTEWRFWTQRPTDEQRKAVKWDE